MLHCINKVAFSRSTVCRLTTSFINSALENRSIATLSQSSKFILSKLKLLQIENIMSGRGRGTASVALEVKSCDIFKDENSEKHHTDEYETSKKRLVVRRGQSFTARIELSRDVGAKDKLSFQLQTGLAPRSNHGSLIYLTRLDAGAGDNNTAGIRYSSLATRFLDVEVFLPADMGVGEWRLALRAKTGSRYTTTFAIESLVILFNPWVKEDQTYMKDEKWRNEYVLNDIGRLYYGSARHIGAMEWVFGQFESVVLDAALKLISMDRMRYSDRFDPVQVSRHMSALVNSNDDDGVLVGNWSGDYADGTNPSDWVSSPAILQEFMDNNAPVQYGQCWVFSGVLCTILRSLGIPTRSVTNFESAHDTDGNLTVDYHYDHTRRPMDNDDSVWNFHVWNDVWMARPDLPEGFGGWQALDATPQESSGGKFQCGPMSVNAIKQGYIKYDYDGPFIYAEVNATKRHWIELKERTADGEQWDELMSNTSAVGKNISTKAVGSNGREDVTLKYKYAEGTKEEELSFKVARSFAAHTHKARKVQDASIHFDVDIPDNVPFGSDISVNFKFKNVTNKQLNIFVSTVAKIMQYNGSVVAKIFDKDLNATIKAGETKNLTTTMAASSWITKIKGKEGIKFFVLGGVTDTNQVIAYQDNVAIDLPKITVKAAQGNHVKVGEKVVLDVSFTNPLPTALTGGVIRYSGAGAEGTAKAAKINGKSKFNMAVTVVPKRLGNRTIVIGFSSPLLSGLQGEIDLTVV